MVRDGESGRNSSYTYKDRVERKSNDLGPTRYFVDRGFVTPNKGFCNT